MNGEPSQSSKKCIIECKTPSVTGVPPHDTFPFHFLTSISSPPTATLPAFLTTSASRRRLRTFGKSLVTCQPGRPDYFLTVGVFAAQSCVVVSNVVTTGPVCGRGRGRAGAGGPGEGGSLREGRGTCGPVEPVWWQVELPRVRLAF